MKNIAFTNGHLEELPEDYNLRFDILKNKFSVDDKMNYLSAKDR
jgi:hypothetical protein